MERKQELDFENKWIEERKTDFGNTMLNILWYCNDHDGIL